MGSFSSARSVEKASQAFGHTVRHGLRYPLMWGRFTSDAGALSRGYNLPVRRRGSCYPSTSDLMLMGR